MASISGSGGGSSYAGSVASSRSSASLRARAEREHQDGQGEDLLDRRSPLENGIFGVLFTLSKENSETRIRIRWTLLKILLDAWQLFTTVISPAKQGWNINPDGTAWVIVGVLNFTWLSNLGYGAYLAVLYSMVALLMGNVGLCVWVAWCFKEHKFPVVWPIKVLRVFSSVFFQAFDVTSLNLLQLGISCNYTGNGGPRLHMDLFPGYSCSATPHVLHAVVSALSLVLFVAIALLLNMAEVEVNPLSRRPLALGHSGAEVMAFAIKALMTLVDVFIGYRRVAVCVYLALSVALAWQSLRWSPHLVSWVNYLKAGSATTIMWCCCVSMLLVFAPGVKTDKLRNWSEFLTVLMLAGLAPAFCCGALTSYLAVRNMTRTALKSLASAKPEVKLEDVCDNLDDPRDVEIVARCCRVWKDRYTVDPEAINRAHQVIKAGLAMFPNSAYMVLLHGNFMIDVLGVSQSGSSRIEDARKLNPSLVCRFIIFVRHQQATQKAAGNSANDGAHMDLLGYVEYQRKQRMVVRLHREALQAMCNFWKALDASRVSFMHLSRALSKIESSVSQAQTAYRVVLENYGHNPKLVRLYGRFLQTIKNDPWRASEYFTEADRLEELKNGDARGPLLPDGTPLGRMDEMSTAVLVINASGEVQMANRHTHMLFGYKRGTLEGKSITTLLAPHTARRVSEALSGLVASTAIASAMSGEEGGALEELAVGMHYDRLAFPVKLSLRKVSGVGEDSTFVAMLEPVSPVAGMSSLWVAPNGTVAACDPQFVSYFGWKASEVNGSNLMAFMSVSAKPERLAVPASDEETGAPGGGEAADAGYDRGADTMSRLLASARASIDIAAAARLGRTGRPAAVRCIVAHKYDSEPLPATLTVTANTTADIPMLEVRIKLDRAPAQLLVANRKGAISHASLDLVTTLKDVARHSAAGPRFGAGGAGLLAAAAAGGSIHGGAAAGARFGAPTGAAAGAAIAFGAVGAAVPGAEELSGYTLFDFMASPWKEMHIKYLKDSTAANSPPARNQWSCRKASLFAPALELRTAAGKPLYMRVAVGNLDIAGETSHVVRLARSSLEAALTDRRLRLGLTEEGLVSYVGENSASLFGLDPGKIIGRGLWEIVEEADSADPGRLATPGPRMLTALVSKSLALPEHSWRVTVSPPQRAAAAAGKPSTILELAAAARTSLVKPAVMQVHIEASPGDAGAGDSEGEESLGIIYVDLWPIAAVTGVLDLDSSGRIRTVLEERLRPAGLLFGVPSHALVGSTLGDLVGLPPGRKPGDLLSHSNMKKSSLKTTGRKESSVKVGPVHVLQASHVDGRPALLDVQVVGKPGPNQVLHAILRFHVAPMMPGMPGAEAGGGGGVPRAGFTGLPPPPAVAGGRRQSTGGASVVAAAAAAVAAAAGAKFGSMRLDRAQSPAAAKDGLGGAPSRLRSKVEGAATGGKSSAGGGGPEPSTPSPPPAAAAPAATRSLSAELVDRVLLPTLEELTQTGYSVAAAHEGPVRLASCPPDVLVDGMPLPGVTAAGRAAHASGRSKLAGMVKAAGSRGGGGGDGSAGGWGSGSGGARKPSTPLQRGSGGGSAGGAAARLLLPLGSPPLPRSPYSKAVTGDFGEALMRGTTKASTMKPLDVRSVGGSDDQDSDKERRPLDTGLNGASRISTWVASKGAFYQNTVQRDALSDDENRSRRSADFSDGPGGPDAVTRARMGSGAGGGDGDGGFGASEAVPLKGPMSPGVRSDIGGYADEDAASEGGQSAMSAQSASGGAEYKRGKRFRKLIKLMDSSQAQQVQQRFRTHALATVALLALVHVVCFVLVVTAIQSQRTSMLNLGHNGEAQRYMHQIMTDVRSLDVISVNRTLPTLYTANDTQMFLDRVARNAEIVKSRLNDILDGHHRSDSKVLELFYYSPHLAWGGNDLDGSDIYINLTAWDFSTRFYTMSTHIVQNWELWMRQGQRIADTSPGQFLLKSGPDIFRLSRKILDELLFEAAANVHWVDTLQLIFLAVEGTVISSLAALYLAYLLRAVAAQRHKLYATFLVVPLGLTRALASQNTNLLVDDDDDDDMSDEEDRAVAAVAEEAGDGDEDGGDGGAVATKGKRRATLNVAELTSPVSDGEGGGGGGGLRRAMGHSTSFATRVSGGGGGPSDKFLRQHSMTAESAEARPEKGWRGGFKTVGRFWQAITRRGRVVMPLPLSAGGLAAGGMPTSKRKLKDDSHETFVMMLPFVFWSAVVITIYSVAVIHMKGVVDVVAIHSVSNFMSARTYRAVFYSQELAVVTDPALLPAKRGALQSVIKLVTDAWYTLQLGSNAYRAAGPNTERFPLVNDGLAYASEALADIFYGTGRCHRTRENLPCLGPDSRFYRITNTGLDSMMQQFMMSITAMATNKSSTSEGLESENFDFIYNVGAKDLLDGTITVEQTHYDTILALFHRIMVLHVVLFLVLWVVFAGFLVLLLNPLLQRISKERRRIAELMSQLPLELDVERLVARALGTLAAPGAPGSAAGSGVGGSLGGQLATAADDASEAEDDVAGKGDATSKWKAIIRSASSGLNAARSRPSFTSGPSGSVKKG